MYKYNFKDVDDELDAKVDIEQIIYHVKSIKDNDSLINESKKILQYIKILTIEEISIFLNESYIQFMKSNDTEIFIIFFKILSRFYSMSDSLTYKNSYFRSYSFIDFINSLMIDCDNIIDITDRDSREKNINYRINLFSLVIIMLNDSFVRDYFYDKLMKDGFLIKMLNRIYESTNFSFPLIQKYFQLHIVLLNTTVLYKRNYVCFFIPFVNFYVSIIQNSYIREIRMVLIECMLSLASINDDLYAELFSAKNIEIIIDMFQNFVESNIGVFIRFFFHASKGALNDIFVDDKIIKTMFERVQYYINENINDIKYITAYINEVLKLRYESLIKYGDRLIKIITDHLEDENNTQAEILFIGCIYDVINVLLNDIFQRNEIKLGCRIIARIIEFFDVLEENHVNSYRSIFLNINNTYKGLIQHLIDQI